MDIKQLIKNRLHFTSHSAERIDDRLGKSVTLEQIKDAIASWWHNAQIDKDGVVSMPAFNGRFVVGIDGAIITYYINTNKLTHRYKDKHKFRSISKEELIEYFNSY